MSSFSRPSCALSLTDPCRYSEISEKTIVYTKWFSFIIDTLAWVRVNNLSFPLVFTVAFSLPKHPLLKQNPPAISQMHHIHSCFDSFSLSFLIPSWLKFCDHLHSTCRGHSQHARPHAVLPLSELPCFGMDLFYLLFGHLNSHFKATPNISFPEVRALHRGCRRKSCCELFISSQ